MDAKTSLSNYINNKQLYHNHNPSFKSVYLIVILFTFMINHFPTASCLLCYHCTSAETGCSLDWVDWRIHSALSCPKTNDKCVKIIEQRGADNFVQRGCLSHYTANRNDIPADHYEGCRPSTRHPKEAIFVKNEIKELQLQHQTRYFKNVTWCFCEFDHWCNSVGNVHPTFGLIAIILLCNMALRMIN